ncbi:immunity 52 family protein [Archangium violaceum]|uniref:immunity 52 family protein n=1 Tax=Archangium violaceum TaxID=83451 RepID=UPI00193C2B17|nr:immunity 52 family protein [Archangium violaceum]QRK10800.1 immunity 52 family protein [Archangium violaceum]
MKETYYVGAYWLSRRESAETCAQRAESFFRLLASCDPSLAHWFRKGRTLEEALKHRLEPDAASLAKVFHQQAQKEGRFADDGFSLRGWNGQTHEAASTLSLLCGDASVWVSNSCLFNPPEEGPAEERVLQTSVLAQILRAMAMAFEPEWGIATSSQHRNLVAPESARAGTFVGWLMYFSHRRGPLPPLPPPVHIEAVENKGTLVILTPERFTASNPAHVELARDVAERLAQAGLLTPLRPWET